ncbi:hypothetical protein J6590_023868 [Homalodisca vitripennis]|nr:hypothetical protein J6590_023868 [Homalodisca vitripennis]
MTITMTVFLHTKILLSKRQVSTPTDDPSDILEKIPAAKRLRIIEKTLIKFMNKAPTPTVEVPDDDKSFFDSIIPAVKSLSLDHKLEFRCEVMKLISRYRSLERTGAYQNHPPFSAAPTSCSSTSHLSGTGYSSNPSGSPSGPSYTTLSPYGSSSVNSNYGDSMDIFGSEDGHGYNTRGRDELRAAQYRLRAYGALPRGVGSKLINLLPLGIREKHRGDLYGIAEFVGREPMIDACHTLGKKVNTKDTPGIIVKFVRRVDAEALLKKRREKRDFSTRHLNLASDNPIYINESLSPTRRRLLGMARQVRRERGYKWLWVRGEIDDYKLTLACNGIESLINDPTRVNTNSKTCLDHVLVKSANKNKLEIEASVIDVCVSDHYMTAVCMQVGAPPAPSDLLELAQLSYRVNNEQLIKNLEMADWNDVFQQRNASIAFDSLKKNPNNEVMQKKFKEFRNKLLIDIRDLKNKYYSELLKNYNDTATYKIIESEKVSALWCNGSTFTRQVRDPGSTPGLANTATYKIIESEKVSALWCNGSTFTRQVRDPGSTPGGASTFCDSMFIENKISTVLGYRDTTHVRHVRTKYERNSLTTVPLEE